MYSKRKIICLFLVILSVFSFNLMNVNAYMTKTSASVVNNFSVASFYKNTYTYNLNNNGSVTKLGEKEEFKIAGDTVNIDNPNIDVSSYVLDSITINGNGSYSIGDTYTQPASNLNIVYTYKPKNLQTYTVTYTGETANYSYTGATTVEEGSTYTSVITATGGYSESQIDTVTVRMNGNVVQNAWDSSTSTVTVTNVSGNIEINVTTNCLVEGTRIMLWDGSYKNVEDITYNDLLKVWNHETGSYGYEYPAWIEKAGKVSQYTKVTFSDGTELKIASDHRLFSKRLNKYVNINSGKLNIGDEVVSLKNGISYVSIVNIETVKETANYYHVITTRYFNMIAEGLLTTYEINNEISSNYKEFDNDLKWVNYTPEDKKMSYEEVLNTFGYVDKYLYKAMKIEDFKYAIEQGFITQEALESIIKTYMRQDGYKVIPPKDNNGKYLWIVATSDDNDPSDISHQMVEDSEYIVPEPKDNKNFKYWYNHSDNKQYQPGDKIIVDSSMYLEAIYE